MKSSTSVMARLAAIIYALAVSLPLQAQFVQLSATEDAKLHTAVVNDATGDAIAGAVVRVLSGPEFRLFTKEQVQQLDKSLDVFSEAAIATTDKSGIATMDSPLNLDVFSLYGLGGNDVGHFIVHVPGTKPLTGPARIGYSRAEITGRQFLVKGKVHAGYLSTFHVVTGKNVTAPSLASARTGLKVTPSSASVLKGDDVTLKIQWRYALMPLIQSTVEVEGAIETRLDFTNGESGVIDEQWTVHRIRRLLQPPRH
jgi:hypothetical protein